MWLLSVVLALGACTRDRVHQGIGELIARSADGRQVTIRPDHDVGLDETPVLRGVLQDPGSATDLAEGSRVRFEAHRRGTDVVITRLTRAPAGRPGIHDHSPHHGGLVSMVGMLHLEGLAQPDGELRVYLSDLRRHPLPVDDVTGSVTVMRRGTKLTLPLARADGYLTASAPHTDDTEVHARFVLNRAGQELEATFVLPVAVAAPAAAAVSGDEPPP